MKHANRSRLAGALVALVAASGIVAQSAPAHAAGCYYRSGQEITTDEYAALTPGMTFPEVRAITGSGGLAMDDIAFVRASGVMDRTWHTCARSGWALMRFERAPGQGFVLQWTDARWS